MSSTIDTNNDSGNDKNTSLTAVYDQNWGVTSSFLLRAIHSSNLLEWKECEQQKRTEENPWKNQEKSYRYTGERKQGKVQKATPQSI